MSAEQDRIDAERWRYIRQILHVERWELSPASQLGAYTFKVPCIVGRSDATVEEIIDAARASSSSSSTPLSETPKDSRDGDVRNEIDAMSRSAAASFIAFEDALPSLAPLSEPTSEGT